MKHAHQFRSRSLVVVALLLMVFTTAARAQSPTPEGTVIHNTSTVTYTDANGNTYSSQSASADVTVGFLAGVDMTGSATASPASPSSNDTLTFTYHNTGNGNDSVRVTESISVGGVITVVGYRVNGTAYASLALLNAALSGIQVAAGATLDIKVAYDVASNKGGVATNYTLNGFSRRTGATTDAQVTTVTPSQSAGVAVTPDNAQNLTKLPSNGTNYTQTFAVVNNGNGVDGFTLVASHPQSAITIVSVNGTAGSSGSLSGIAAGASTNVDVIYSIGNVAAGAKDTLVLTATSTTDAGQSDAGGADITVIRAAIAITKVAYRDDQTTAVGANTVVPGEFLQYKVTVTNNGAASAASVQVTNTTAAELTHIGATGDAAGWSFGYATGVLTADLTGTLAAAGNRYFWIRVQVK